MIKPLFVFRMILVLITALFMAYHVQIFVYRIEPNLIFAWTAALLIEGFLISLALQKTIASRILLIPLFLISVIAASASFIVQNEQLLDQFFTQKRVIEQIKTDLYQTQKAYELGERYITRTLQRERALRDELRAIMRDKTGDITLVNSLIFFFIILVVQSANVYTATSLKDGYWKQIERGTETKVSIKTNETEREKDADGTECLKACDSDCDSLRQSVSRLATASDRVSDGTDRDGVIAELKKLRGGMSYREMSHKFGVSKDTVSRIITENGQGISDEIFRKIAEKL
jgi:hypothetical protein